MTPKASAKRALETVLAMDVQAWGELREPIITGLRVLAGDHPELCVVPRNPTTEMGRIGACYITRTDYTNDRYYSAEAVYRAMIQAAAKEGRAVWLAEIVAAVENAKTYIHCEGLAAAIDNIGTVAIASGHLSAASPDDVVEMVYNALIDARIWFNDYAILHMEKGTPEGNKKSEMNAHRAGVMKEALQALAPFRKAGG